MYPVLHTVGGSHTPGESIRPHLPGFPSIHSIWKWEPESSVMTWVRTPSLYFSIVYPLVHTSWWWTCSPYGSAAVRWARHFPWFGSGTSFCIEAFLQLTDCCAFCPG